LPWIIVLAPLIIPILFIALAIYLLPPIPRFVWFILAGLALVALAYSQNGRIIEWIDRVPWLRKNRKRLARSMRPIGVTMILGSLGALISQLNLRVFSRLYLRSGSLRPPSGT
jgi:hypothetical protein